MVAHFWVSWIWLLLNLWLRRTNWLSNPNCGLENDFRDQGGFTRVFTCQQPNLIHLKLKRCFICFTYTIKVALSSHWWNSGRIARSQIFGFKSTEQQLNSESCSFPLNPDSKRKGRKKKKTLILLLCTTREWERGFVGKYPYQVCCLTSNMASKLSSVRLREVESVRLHLCINVLAAVVSSGERVQLTEDCLHLFPRNN